MLSYPYWRDRFAANPMVLNQTALINGHRMTIVGVGPAGFGSIDATANPQVYVPIMMKAQMTPAWNDLENRRSRWLT
jgi:putative ABC transport system permease protein